MVGATRNIKNPIAAGTHLVLEAELIQNLADVLESQQPLLVVVDVESISRFVHLDDTRYVSHQHPGETRHFCLCSAEQSTSEVRHYGFGFVAPKRDGGHEAELSDGDLIPKKGWGPNGLLEATPCCIEKNNNKKCREDCYYTRQR